jgi:hypothetical protein
MKTVKSLSLTPSHATQCFLLLAPSSLSFLHIFPDISYAYERHFEIISLPIFCSLPPFAFLSWQLFCITYEVFSIPFFRTAYISIE